MADLEKTIKIILQGVDKDMARTFANAARDLDTYKGAVMDITGPLADLSKSILKTEAAVLAAGVAMIGVAINEAGKFESQFSEIRTLFEATPEAVEAFEKSILQYARTSTSSIGDINKAIYTAISSGREYTESVDLIRTAEALATSGRSDLESTTRLLASAMNAYGAEADEAGRYSDVFMRTVQLGQITVPELAEGLSRLTGIAAAADVPIETLAAAIAEMTKKGDPASTAMTGLQGALAAMIKPTEQAKTLAGDLGIEFGAAALKSKGFEGVLKDVYDATGGNVEQIGQLFGRVQGLTAVLKLVGEDGGQQFMATMDEMQNSAGTTATALDKVARNFENINQTLKNQIQVTMIEAGLPLLDAYKDIADGIGDIFEGISIGMKSDAFAPVYQMIEGFMRDLGQYFKDIAEVMPEALEGVDFSGLVDSLGRLGRTIRDLFQAVFGAGDLTEAEDLEEALQRIVNGIKALTDLSTEIIGKLQPLAEVLGRVFAAGTTDTSDWTGMIGSILGLGYAADLALNALDGFANIIISIAAIGWAAKTTAVTAFATAIKGLVIALGPIVAAGGVGIAIGTFLNQFTPVQDVAQSFAAWTDKLFNWTGQAGKAGQAVDDLNISIEEIRRQALTAAIIEMGVEVNTEDVRELQRIFDDLSGRAQNIEVDIEPNSNIFEKLEELGYSLNAIPDELFVQIAAMADVKEAEKALLDFEAARELSYKIDVPEQEKEKIVFLQELEDGTLVPIEIEMDPKAPEKIEETKKSLKELEFEAKIRGEFDIEAMKESAETMRTALKFKAEVDIAQIKAEFELAETIAKGLSDAFQSTGDVISAIFGAIGELSDAGFRPYQIQRMLDREYELREKALDAQIKLNDAQIEYFRARAEALNRGDALIKIEGDGLAPHLEAFMWEVLSAIQVRVNEEGMDMLLGAVD
jgi:TP901 family phage tail tape measure protein